MPSGARVRSGSNRLSLARLFGWKDGFPIRAQGRALRARRLLRQENAEAALALAERLAARHPDAGGPRALAALSLKHLDRMEEALAHARAATERAPGSLWIARAAGVVAIEAGDDKLAGERLAIAASAARSDPELWYLLARARLAAGLLAEADESSKAALALSPKAPRYLALRGRVLERSGRSDEAASLLRKAVEGGVRDARVVDVLSRALEAAGDAEGAAETLERFGSGPKQAYGIVRLFLRTGDAARALVHAEHAAEEDPRNPWNHLARAAVLRRRGDLSGALESVRAARRLEDDPTFEQFEEQVSALVTTLSGNWVPPLDGPQTLIDPISGRVLHLLDRSLPHTQSGFTVRSLNIVTAQRAIGLEPIVATRLGVPRIGGVHTFPPTEEVGGVPHHRLMLPGVKDYDALPKDVYLRQYAAEAAKLVERIRPSVLHPAGGHLNGLVGLALKRRFGLPLVYEVRNFYSDLWASEGDGLIESELYLGRTRAETQCMRGADRVVTISEAMKADIVSRGIDPGSVSVVPNAVDTERFAPRPRNETLLQSVGLQDRIVLGYVSGLRRYEGIDVLLRSIAVLRARGHRVGALIVGEGPEMDSLRRLVSDLGIGEETRMVGRVPYEDVLDYYALIDIFVVPRRNDRVGSLIAPLKPFEAMAMGLPLLVGDLPVLAEIAAPGERGLVFSAEDPESLATEAERLILDEDLRRRLGSAGRRWVERERTWTMNALRYRSIYEELLEAPRRPSVSIFPDMTRSSAEG